ncbi:hypothetical protein [Streptomyces sp. TLI_105]|nr:hypothetical protein [Streptomyces sp. TLI_105]SEB84846.1 hypothetical protein SAMN05428939_0888 [Streptomyces sp. TLI_105]
MDEIERPYDGSAQRCRPAPRMRVANLDALVEGCYELTPPTALAA